MSRIRLVRGFLRRCRGLFDVWESPGCLAGAYFLYGVGLEGADAVAEFVG